MANFTAANPCINTIRDGLKVAFDEDGNVTAFIPRYPAIPIWLDDWAETIYLQMNMETDFKHPQTWRSFSGYEIHPTEIKRFINCKINFSF